MKWKSFTLNPKFKDYLEKHPDVTIFGLTWSMYWRLTLLVLIVEFVLFLSAFLVFKIFSIFF